MQTYTLRYNFNHKGWILISCCFGHSIGAIKLDRSWAGSNSEVMVSSRSHICSDCRELNIPKSANA